MEYRQCNTMHHRRAENEIWETWGKIKVFDAFKSFFLLFHFSIKNIRFVPQSLKANTPTHSFSPSSLHYISLAFRFVIAGVVCCYLADESCGGALSHPQAELPLLPLPQLSLHAGGDEDRILVYKWLMKNLENKWAMQLWVCLDGFLYITMVNDVTTQLEVREGRRPIEDLHKPEILRRIKTRNTLGRNSETVQSCLTKDLLCILMLFPSVLLPQSVFLQLHDKIRV